MMTALRNTVITTATPKATSAMTIMKITTTRNRNLNITRTVTIHIQTSTAKITTTTPVTAKMKGHYKPFQLSGEF